MNEKATPYLASPARTMAVLDKYGFSFKKQYGQNFLIDPNILEGIIRGANITGEDTVLEIGPGIGTLTQYLCANSKKVYAVEIDKRLIPVLEDTLSDYDNVEVINEDILKLDINAKLKGEPFCVVANLPYYITTPIVMKLLESRLNIKSITVMVQTEVAYRMSAVPSTKDYGALSLAVQYYAQPKRIMDVPPNCFIPKPNVGSSVVSLIKYDEPQIKAKDTDFMFKIIKAAFSMRRKTLVNCLGKSGIEKIDKERVENALNIMGLDSRIRGEALSLEQFKELSDLLL